MPVWDPFSSEECHRHFTHADTELRRQPSHSTPRSRQLAHRFNVNMRDNVVIYRSGCCPSIDGFRSRSQQPACCDASCGSSLSGSKNKCAGCNGSANRRVYPFQKKSIKLQQMMAIGYRSQYLHKRKSTQMCERRAGPVDRLCLRVAHNTDAVVFVPRQGRRI